MSAKTYEIELQNGMVIEVTPAVDSDGKQDSIENTVSGEFTVLSISE